MSGSNRVRAMLLRWLSADRRKLRARRVARRGSVESLEARLLPAASAIVAADDDFTFETNTDSDFRSHAFDVMRNDLTTSTAPLVASMKVTAAPEHGTAEVVEVRGLKQMHDDNSPVGNGRASAVAGVVDEFGHLKLKVGGLGSFGSLWTSTVIGTEDQLGADTPSSFFNAGDYRLRIRYGTDSFDNFDPNVFDVEYNRRQEWLIVSGIDIPGLTPDTPFIAWIDNQVGNGTPDTYMVQVGPYKIQYEPESGFVGDDVLRYSVLDTDGNWSNEATVTIHVAGGSEVRAVAQPTAAVAAKQTPVLIRLPAGDVNPGTPVFDLVIDDPPQHGVLSDLSVDGYGAGVAYTPEDGFAGPDQFSYHFEDEFGATSAPVVVNITVRNNSPVLVDDAAYPDSGQPIEIDVLANDFDTDGTLDRDSLSIAAPPSHGTVELISTSDGPRVVYTPAEEALIADSFTYTVRDDNGAVSTGRVWINPGPIAGNDHATTRLDAPVKIDFLGNDAPFSNESPLDDSTVTFVRPPQHGTVELITDAVDHFKMLYTPSSQPRFLTVNDPRDLDDGDYSAGHLSLREAIKLANGAHYRDTFTYTISDNHGIVSNVATVSIDVTPAFTTVITFSPTLTKAGGLKLTGIGDTSDDNTAFAITGNIEILGPAGGPPFTIRGLGPSADLRLFLVKPEASLRLSNLTLSDGASDGSGGTLKVEGNAAATLTNCRVLNSYAVDKGGAIFNVGDLAIVGSRFEANTAAQGGAISNFGPLQILNATFFKNVATDFGGALDHEAGETSILGTTFRSNSAKSRGGAIFNSATLFLVDSQLLGNSADDGGGLFNAGDVEVTGGRISGNSAKLGGGFKNEFLGVLPFPLAVSIATLHFDGTQITSNSATDGGGGYNSSVLMIAGGLVGGNRASRGGGLFQTDRSAVQARFSSLELDGVRIDSNRATQNGGGLFLDLGTATISNSQITRNTGRRDGGGIFDRTNVQLTGSTVSRNEARRGGGIFHAFATLTADSTSVRRNRASQGANTFNDRGTVNGLVAVSPAASAAPSGPSTSSSPVPAQGNTSLLPNVTTALDWSNGYAVLPKENRDYRLDDSGVLRSRVADGSWTVVARDITDFATLPNGDLYVLTRNQELRKLQLGVVWTTLVTGVRSIEQSGNGVLYALDNLNRLWRYSSLEDYFILPATDESAAIDPPEAGRVLEAASIAPANMTVGGILGLQSDIIAERSDRGFPLRRELGQILGTEIPPDYPDGELPWSDLLKAYNNLRLIVEPINDSVTSVGTIPGVGQVKLHHAQYKATIYGTSLNNDAAVVVIYLDHDHLHLVESPQPNSSNVGEPEHTATVASQSPVNARPIVSHVTGSSLRESYAPVLAKAADGTLYHMGVEDTDDRIYVQGEPAAYSLWRLNPDSLWRPLPRVLGMALGPDSTLYALKPGRELESLSSTGSDQWVTIDRGVKTFGMRPDGTLVWVNDLHELKARPAGSTEATTLAAGVRFMAMQMGGDVFFLDTQGNLRQLDRSGDSKVVKTGVQDFAMVDDAITVLTTDGHLQSSTRRGWTTLQTRVASFTIDADGTLYAVTTTGLLLRQTSVGDFEELQHDIQSVQIAPNRDLYALTGHHDLLRMKLGYFWATLQGGVKSFEVDEYGSVWVQTINGQRTTYASLPQYRVDTSHDIARIPTPDSIVRDLAMGGINGQGLEWPDALFNDVQYFPTGPSSESKFGPFGVNLREFKNMPWNNVRMVVDPVLDQVDPPRFFPNVGLAQLHHLQFHVAVYGTTLVLNPSEVPEDQRTINEEAIESLFVDRDFLVLLDTVHDPLAPDVALNPYDFASTANEPAAASPAPQSAASTSPGFPVQRPVDRLLESTTKSPDGTLYRLGGGQSEHFYYGSEHGPWMLWQLHPGKEWLPVDYVYSYAVDPDSQLYILNKDHELRNPGPSVYRGEILARDIQDFVLRPDGSLLALTQSGELHSLAANATEWTTIDTGARSLLKAPNGSVLILTEAGDLRRLANNGNWVFVDSGVTSAAVLSDNQVYELNGRHELVLWNGTATRTVVAHDVNSFEVSADGEIVALTSSGDLMQRTVRGHWVTVRQNVTDFRLSPNSDLYAIDGDHSLQRFGIDREWSAVDADVQSLQVFSDGTVEARHGDGSRTLFSARNPAVLEAPGIEALDEPIDSEILKAANIVVVASSSPAVLATAAATAEFDDQVVTGWSGYPSVTRQTPRLTDTTVVLPVPDQLEVSEARILKVKRVDEITGPRFVDGIGPVRVHELCFECTIYYTTVDGELGMVTLLLNTDHYVTLEA